MPAVDSKLQFPPWWFDLRNNTSAAAATAAEEVMGDGGGGGGGRWGSAGTLAPGCTVPSEAARTKQLSLQTFSNGVVGISAENYW